MPISKQIQRFTKLRIPIHNVEGDLLEAFPELQRYQAFKNYGVADRDMFIKFICYTYDPASDLHAEYADFSELKEEAAKLAGFSTTKKKFDNHTLRRVLDGDFIHPNPKAHIDRRPEKVFDMIYTFITRIVNKVRWTQYCTDLIQYENICRLRMVDASVSDANKIVQLNKIADQLVEKLEIAQKTIFMGDEDVARESVNRTPMLTPEVVADQELIPR